MLSNASKYAIKAILYLAENSNSKNKISVKDITKVLDVPSPFLAKILQQLVKSKLISSTKGPNGGFYLDDKNKENNICDIIEEIDGKNKLNNCFMGLHSCDANNPCPVHHIVEPFKNKLYTKFRDISILEFASEIKNNRIDF